MIRSMTRAPNPEGSPRWVAVARTCAGTGTRSKEPRLGSGTWVQHERAHRTKNLLAQATLHRRRLRASRTPMPCWRARAGPAPTSVPSSRKSCRPSARPKCRLWGEVSGQIREGLAGLRQPCG
jgi:hypothetical protein